MAPHVLSPHCSHTCGTDHRPLHATSPYHSIIPKRNKRLLVLYFCLHASSFQVFHHTSNITMEIVMSCILVFPFSVDGKFTLWTSWGQCSKTCGSGIQTRFRSCINPPPANGGKDCMGPRNETRQCQITACVRK